MEYFFKEKALMEKRIKEESSHYQIRQPVMNVAIPKDFFSQIEGFVKSSVNIWLAV